MQDNEILAQLKEKTEGLFFLSESDYPFETLRWGSSDITDDFLRNLPAENSQASVEERSFEDFYQKYAGKDHNRPATLQQLADSYRPAFDVLRKNLTDLRVYRVGRVNIGVYLVGKSDEGNWLGLSTRSVET